MRQPFFMPPQRMMPQMPIAPRFPMYAPYMMRQPMNPIPMNTMPPMPPQMPSQIPGVAAATAAAGAAGVAGAAGAPRLEGLLAGANSLFENAQKFTPYIQQATPMFKNLPALWRLYRGFKGSSAPDPLESSTIVAPVERPPRQPRQSRRARQETQQYVPIKPKPSVPMIFQPPFE